MESKSCGSVHSKFVSNKRKRFTELAKLRTAKYQPTAGATAESALEQSPPTEAAESAIGESSTLTSPPMEVGVSNLSPVESVNESPGWEGASLSPEAVHLEQSTSSGDSEPESVEPLFAKSVDSEPCITEELSCECWSQRELSITEELSSVSGSDMNNDVFMGITDLCGKLH